MHSAWEAATAKNVHFLNEFWLRQARTNTLHTDDVSLEEDTTVTVIYIFTSPIDVHFTCMIAERVKDVCMYLRMYVLYVYYT